LPLWGARTLPAWRAPSRRLPPTNTATYNYHLPAPLPSPPARCIPPRQPYLCTSYHPYYLPHGLFVNCPTSSPFQRYAAPPTHTPAHTSPFYRHAPHPTQPPPIPHDTASIWCGSPLPWAGRNVCHDRAVAGTLHTRTTPHAHTPHPLTAPRLPARWVPSPYRLYTAHLLNTTCPHATCYLRHYSAPAMTPCHHLHSATLHRLPPTCGRPLLHHQHHPSAPRIHAHYLPPTTAPAGSHRTGLAFCGTWRGRCGRWRI